jgi:hypothetical protein
MLKNKQPNQDIERAVNHIISKDQEKFSKFKEFKEHQTQRFNILVFSVGLFLIINQILIISAVSKSITLPIFISSLIVFGFLIFKFCTKVEPNYKDVSTMFSKKNVANILTELNISNKGRISFFQIDNIVCDKLH